jgi:hypothetical protein
MTKMAFSPSGDGGVSMRLGHRSLHHAQATAVLDHSRALPRCGRSGPAFTRRAEGGECDLIVLDPGDMLHDAFAVRSPRIYAEGVNAVSNFPKCAEVKFSSAKASLTTRWVVACTRGLATVSSQCCN